MLQRIGRLVLGLGVGLASLGATAQSAEVSASDPITLVLDGKSTLGWAFKETAGWRPGRSSRHLGDDFFAVDWNTRSGNLDKGEQIFSVASGTVIFIEKGKGTVSSPDEINYGNQVIVQLDDDPRFALRYAHLENVFVEKDDHVRIGIDRIGTLGFSGLTGAPPFTAHLHLVLYQKIDQTPDPSEGCILGRPAKPAIEWLKQGKEPCRIEGMGRTKFAAEYELDRGLAAFGAVNVDVALIIDSSGSMLFNDPANDRLDAAKIYLNASAPGDRVAVVDFDQDVELKSGLRVLPGEKKALIDAIDTIDSSGATNIRDGIALACNELLTNGKAVRRGAILLSNGQHNIGPFGNPQDCFAERGWPIFAFGLGAADVVLLQGIADDTGGEFALITDVSNLSCEFQRVRAKIAGVDPGPCLVFVVGPGETIAFTETVPPGRLKATFSTNWVGSDVVMSLITPSGRAIDRDTEAPDVAHNLGPSFEVYGVTNPEPGVWEVSLFGVDVPPEGEEIVFALTSLPAPVLVVDIDIKPDSDPNAINCNNEKGVIPVAILTTETFDATTVDHTTVTFEGASETHVDKKSGQPLRHEEDVDGDGDTDLLFHFRLGDTDLACDFLDASLTGETFDGIAIIGTDAVRMVDKGGGKP